MTLPIYEKPYITFDTASIFSWPNDLHLYGLNMYQDLPTHLTAKSVTLCRPRYVCIPMCQVSHPPLTTICLDTYMPSQWPSIDQDLSVYLCAKSVTLHWPRAVCIPMCHVSDPPLTKICLYTYVPSLWPSIDQDRSAYLSAKSVTLHWPRYVCILKCQVSDPI